MGSLTHWLAVGAAAMVAAATARGGELPPKPAAADSKPASPASPETTKPPVRSLDALKLPPGAILVICKELKEALDLVPQGVVLTLKEYKAMRDRIEELERLVKAAKPEPRAPTACKLVGNAAGDVVQFQVQFDIRTHRPDELVALGCQRTWPRSASLDGHVPVLLPTDDGLLVQVARPGTHRLSLELEMAVVSKGAKGSEQGFDFGLPRAAITTLEELTLPGAVAEVRVNNRSWQPKVVDGQKSRLEGVLLGAADRLDVAWKGAVPQKGDPLLAADAQIAVGVFEARVTIEADLMLQVLQGGTKEWRLQVPANTVAEVKDENVERVDQLTAQKPELIIHLKERSSRPLQVKLRVHQARSGNKIAVGPFAVFGAVRQQGTMVVSASPEYRLQYHLHGDVSQRDIPENKRQENAVAAFTYWNLPTAKATAPLAPLELEVERVQGAVETHVVQALRLDPASGWRLTTRIEATPIRMAVDHLEVELPAGFQYDKGVGVSPADLVENPVEIKQAAQRRVAQIKLAQRQRARFAVTLPGLYPVRSGDRQASLELPRPLQALDRGGEVTVTVPEGFELVSGAAGPDSQSLPLAGVGQAKDGAHTREYSWRPERVPSRVDVAWRPHQPELRIDTVVDVTLMPGQARVEQRLQLRFSQEPPAWVVLRVPAALTDRIRVIKGGTALGSDGTVAFTKAEGKEHILVLAYSFDLPEPAPADAPHPQPAPQVGAGDAGAKGKERQFSVAMVWLTRATRQQTKVRVWTDRGLQPVLAAGPWEQRQTERVEDRDSLPALVLWSGGMDVPLVLREIEPAGAPLARVAVERALIQVVVGKDAQQIYRARFRLNHLGTHVLEAELPAPATSNLSVAVNGKKLTTWSAVDGGTVARIHLEPSLYNGPVILELRYQLAPEAKRGNSRFRTALSPPVLRGEVFLGPVRWQVELPQAWVAVYQDGDSDPEQRWELRRGLLAPRPAISSSDLEHWLGEPTLTAQLPWADAGEPSLVCWRRALTPLHVVHAPQQAWLLVCSLAILALGLALSLAALPRVVSWLALVIVGLGAAAAAILWPSVLPAVVYGCEPGAVVLILVLGFQWMLHRRYRRQVVFLPAFTRLKTGSSLVRSGPRSHATPRPGAREGQDGGRGQPSTIDAPPTKESSVKQKRDDGGPKAEGSRP